MSICSVFLLLLFFYSLLQYVIFFFFFKQKTAYEMRISDWSSDVCSSDLRERLNWSDEYFPRHPARRRDDRDSGRAGARHRHLPQDDRGGSERHPAERVEPEIEPDDAVSYLLPGDRDHDRGADPVCRRDRKSKRLNSSH